MSRTISIEEASDDLKGLLDGLQPGETVTLVGDKGEPRAKLVSLADTPSIASQAASDWEEQWKALAEEIGRAWKDDKSAVEVISEMRR
jgi:antitoxin (DNA-binding transcriptional repressor) of toxin-antitoxin stability system